MGEENHTLCCVFFPNSAKASCINLLFIHSQKFYEPNTQIIILIKLDFEKNYDVRKKTYKENTPKAYNVNIKLR